MIQENELITLILCLVVLFFVISNYTKLKNLSGLKIFIISFSLFSLGWFFTVIEGIIFEDLFNIIEHICYISSSFALFIWSIIFYKKRGRNEPNRDN